MNKKLIVICMLSMFLLSSINAVGIQISNENKEINEKSNKICILGDRVELDIKGASESFAYTIILKNNGFLNVHCKKLEVKVERRNRILDEWSENWNFQDVPNYVINSGEERKIWPYLHRVNFGIGPIKITAKLSGYDFLDVELTKEGYSTGGVIVFGKTKQKSSFLFPFENILFRTILNSNLLKLS